jgi:DNA-binding CsgD family transcriptional regulator
VPRAIAEACRDARDSGELRRVLRGALHRWVPFDAYCVNTCDPTTLVVTSSVGDGLSPRDGLRLFEIESAGADVNLLADLATSKTLVATTWQATQGRVQRSRRMRAIFLPLGLHDELRAPLFAGEACWGYLHLFRTRRPFSEIDTWRIAQVAGEIGRALRRMVAARPRPGSSISPPPALVVVGGEGGVRSLSAGAGEVVRMLDLDGHQPVPHAVYAVAQRARLWRSTPASATIRLPASGWLALNGVALGRGAAIVCAAGPAQVAPQVFLATGLTPREREVAAHLVAGSSNAEIARVLSMGVFTVKDHAKRIFAKTRTTGRSDLAALVHGFVA